MALGAAARESRLRVTLLGVALYVSAVSGFVYVNGWHMDARMIWGTLSPLSTVAFYLAAAITPGANVGGAALLVLASIYCFTRVPRWSGVFILILLIYVVTVVARKWSAGAI